MTKIAVDVGDKTLNFNVDNDDFNQYINEQMPADKVSPAYNLLSRTVVDEDKDALKEAVLIDNTPRGLMVVQIAGVIAGEFGGEVTVSLKKPKKSATA